MKRSRFSTHMNIPLIPVLALVLVIIVSAVGSTLINSAVTRSMDDIDQLRQDNARLTAVSKRLDDELEKTGSLAFIAASAKEQGMVPATIAGTIKNGKILEYSQTLPDGGRQLTTPSTITIYPPDYPLLYNARIINPPTDFPSPEQVDDIIGASTIDKHVCSRESTTIDYHYGSDTPTVICRFN